MPTSPACSTRSSTTWPKSFRERFLAKGRFAAYLEPVSVQVVTHPNPGLLGAAVALRDGIVAE